MAGGRQGGIMIDVIIQRYINLKGTDKDVFLLRDGQKIPYNEVE
jgi:hypothetical protein